MMPSGIWVLSGVVNQRVGKSRLDRAGQGEAVQRIACSSGWEGSCGVTLGSFERSR
jgi:hypothetical protein